MGRVHTADRQCRSEGPHQYGIGRPSSKSAARTWGPRQLLREWLRTGEENLEQLVPIRTPSDHSCIRWTISPIGTLGATG